MDAQLQNALADLHGVSEKASKLSSRLVALASTGFLENKSMQSSVQTVESLQHEITVLQARIRDLRENYATTVEPPLSDLDLAAFKDRFSAAISTLNNAQLTKNYVESYFRPLSKQIRCAVAECLTERQNSLAKANKTSYTVPALWSRLISSAGSF